eukprot:SAG25_NODE_7029_length_511_cov_0.810680_1_plen_67_part_01
MSCNAIAEHLANVLVLENEVWVSGPISKAYFRPRGDRAAAFIAITHTHIRIYLHTHTHTHTLALPLW